ncbi:hypothetical protein EV702DRAFT_431661 [Suillus placidus]|uniref:Uncharacterized protein n=1 Tax=Suillus placidus TaxID=48579 RepID=A0A9P6ZTA8_9AGAM|nr:hypothetical protein EV702DRAFT_431661 [Suillus placidus]
MRLAGNTANSTSDAPSLSRLMRHHSQELFHLSTGSKSTPRRRTRSASPSAARANQRRGPDQPYNSRHPTSGTGDETLTDDMWDQWPDGDFERHATSSDEVCEVAAPLLLAEEEIRPLKRCPSLPTEECAPAQRRSASQTRRVQPERGKKRK